MAVQKKIVKRVFISVAWMMVAVGTIVLLIAATRQQAERTCTDVIVNVKSVEGVQYISEKKILNTISGGRPELMKGQLIKTFDLRQLEKLLESNLWIRNAELFFDNNNVLQVQITERVPVARVFAVSGETFYVDDKGEQLPTTNDQVARVPVFTSFPTIIKPLMLKDSLLLVNVKDVGMYILKHDFWMAQIDQVNINNYEMELIPKLGNHIVLFGGGENAEAKFKRLYLFYQQIMRQTGWNYFSSLDLRFDKQLVAVRRDSASMFKSFMISENRFAISTATDSLQWTNDSSQISKTTQNDSMAVLTSKTSTQKPASVPVKTKSNPLPVKKEKVKVPVITEEADVLNEVKKQTERKPKAVMKKDGN